MFDRKVFLYKNVLFFLFVVVVQDKLIFENQYLQLIELQQPIKNELIILN
jgi:hypothetical protein